MIMFKLNFDCLIVFLVYDICIFFCLVGGDLRIFLSVWRGRGLVNIILLKYWCNVNFLRYF